MAIGTHRHQSGGQVLGAWVALLLLLGGGLADATAQEVRLDTHLPVDSVYIGERFTVSFVAEHPAGVEVLFPRPEASPEVFGDLEVLERTTRAQRSGPGDRRVDSVAYEVATFALDSAQVFPVPVQIIAGGDTSAAMTPARTAGVRSVIGAQSKGIHSVAPLAPFPRPLWTWVLAALLAATLLAGLAYLWWRRRQPSGEPPTVSTQPEVDDQTAYEAATAWIRQLESYDLSDPAAVKPFYVELSNALRVYLVRELGVAALERTTREVVEVLEERTDVPDEAVAQMQAALERADLVKFADARPEREDNEQAIQEARAALDAIEAARPTLSEEIDEVASAA